jgi:hypothetical protein
LKGEIDRKLGGIFEKEYGQKYCGENFEIVG